MELDFSDQIRQLGLTKASDMQMQPDNPQMAMKNKSVCKICGMKWGSCAHANDMGNMMEEGPDHESEESPDEEKVEDSKAVQECADCNCGKPSSECDCADCNSKSMQKSESAKDMKHPDKEDKKDVESEKGNPNAEKEEEMEKSMSGKGAKHPDKEDKKDVESEKGNPNAEKEEEKPTKDNKKFPFDKSKASLEEKIANMLLLKANSFNEKFEQSLSVKNLFKVYKRGLNTYKNTHKPGISLHQWAIARVNLFIKMLSGGNVDSTYSLLDADIAQASNSDVVESNLESYDFFKFSDLEFQLAKISLIEAGFKQSEFNQDLVVAAEDKKKL